MIAGAGAAATSAVFGSYFGVSGTVVGAAFGSVIITVGSTIYQRSLDRTREEVKARIKLPSGRTVDIKRNAPTTAVDLSQQVTIPLQRTGPDGVLRPAPRGPDQHVSPEIRDRRLSPRRLLMLSGVTVTIFVLGLLVVTGVEWVKGSPISGGASGTSVGRVLERSPSTVSGTDQGSGSEHTGRAATTEAPATPEPSASPTASPAPTSEPDSSGFRDSQRRPGTSGSEAPQPTGERAVPSAGVTSPFGG
ncbi:hypothetical protein ACFQE5_14385 [Pseudonocardia hispaniensis]|uniref:Uncharacterized protein n=1 Tax=Pseudonocardia hispaniensis TaxID=904933 RepID=A0ABW1J3J6_9PSEU